VNLKSILGDDRVLFLESFKDSKLQMDEKKSSLNVSTCEC